MSRGVIRGQERRTQTLPENPVTTTPLPLKDKAALDVYMQGGELIVSTTPTIQPPDSEHPTILPGEANSVAETDEATIIDYIVPPMKICFLQFIEVSGENRGEYSVFIGATRASRKRTWWTKFNETFEFCRGYSGMPIYAGVHLSVKVKNIGSGVANFDATAIFILKDI